MANGYRANSPGDTAEAEKDELIEWIEAERLKRGWKPCELARRAGITHGVWCSLIRDKKAPNILTINRLAKALGLRVALIPHHL